MAKRTFLACAGLLLTACGGTASDESEVQITPATASSVPAEPVAEPATTVTAAPQILSATKQAEVNADLNLNALRAYRDYAEQVKSDTGSYPLTKRSFRSAIGAFEDSAEATGGEAQASLGLPEGASLTQPGRIVYRSDGMDYKLIAQRTGDCAIVRAKDPGLIDPKRDYGPGDCIAYGYWTQGAETW